MYVCLFVCLFVCCSACNLSSLPSCLVAQQLPSCIATYVLSPSPGDLVLDMCAAPGHKTAHIASLMKNKGVLIAVERSKKRANEMKSLLSLLGVSIAQVIEGDSAKGDWCCSLGEAQQLKGCFDKVLADVPCTGLGLRPHIICNEVDIHSMKSAAAYQRRFISRGCELLRPEGVLVYSTCSISWAENEENVLWALENLPLSLEQAEPFYSAVHTPQMLHAVRGVQRFCPSGDTIGFFIAKFRKKKEETELTKETT